MPIHVTIVLDSGAFLQNIDEDPSELDVGYFQCGKDNNRNDVADIRAYADAEEVPVRYEKLGKGQINVIRTGGTDPVPPLKISDSLKTNLLRKETLYGKPAPPYDPKSIECTIHFTSGDFCCSMVKDRRFVEVPAGGGPPTGKDRHELIAHNAVAHYDLADNEELRLERDNGTVLFSTNDVKRVPKHLEIEIVANNSTAARFFRDALDLKGRKHGWLPNQGDPPPTGVP